MSRPFDFIGNEKIDINNQKHRDIVIERNKALQSAIENNLYIQEVKIAVRVTTTIDCLVCGTQISNDNFFQYDQQEIEEEIPSVKCGCCNTRYSYYQGDDAFHVILSKPTIPKPISK